MSVAFPEPPPEDRIYTGFGECLYPQIPIFYLLTTDQCNVAASCERRLRREAIALCLGWAGNVMHLEQFDRAQPMQPGKTIA
jgi:hypothetical protein